MPPPRKQRIREEPADISRPAQTRRPAPTSRPAQPAEPTVPEKKGPFDISESHMHHSQMLHPSDEKILSKLVRKKVKYEL